MAPIYLVGMRGSGKTTVGKRLAESTTCEFVDLDSYLCEKHKCTVKDLVSRYGWSGFREKEKKSLEEVSQHAGSIIVATGGGIVLDRDNREFMRKNGLVVWLQATPEIMHARLARNPAHSQRPPLTQKGLLEEIGDILAERKALYEEACHLTVNADQDVQMVCNIILNCMDAPGANI